jgi:hypothetical protein
MIICNRLVLFLISSALFLHMLHLASIIQSFSIKLAYYLITHLLISGMFEYFIVLFLKESIWIIFWGVWMMLDMLKVDFFFFLQILSLYWNVNCYNVNCNIPYIKLHGTSHISLPLFHWYQCLSCLLISVEFTTGKSNWGKGILQ